MAKPVRKTIHSPQVIRKIRKLGLWPDRLLIDVVDAHAEKWPEKPALIDHHGFLTYREVVERSENFAAALIELGVKNGDVVAVQAPNWVELPLSHLALDRIGAIFLPLHDGFREMELRPLLQRAKAKIVLTPLEFRGFSHFDMIKRMQHSLKELRNIIVLRSNDAECEFSFNEMALDGSWRKKLGEDYLKKFRPSPDQPLQVMVSSGTTEFPKCSLLSDNNTMARLVTQYGKYSVHLTADDVLAAIAPAGTGATGYNYPILAALLFGGTSVLMERWDGNNPEKALALIAEHGCTGAIVIPTQLAKLMASGQLEKFDLSRLRFITYAGAKLSEAMAEKAENLLNCRIQTVYGATDGGVPTMTSIDDPEDKRFGTVGRQLPGQELRILDDGGMQLGPGEPGEVCWRGANKSFGYLNDPEGTESVWSEEGFYHSGDIGVIDKEGYLRIVGRKKDMIIRGGRNINPRIIEEGLVRHPAVLDAAVAPMADMVLGERICAFVIFKDGPDSPSLDDLKKFIKESGLAEWHQPEHLVVVDDFPRNAGGKVDKAALARLAPNYDQSEEKNT